MSVSQSVSNLKQDLGLVMSDIESISKDMLGAISNGKHDVVKILQARLEALQFKAEDLRTLIKEKTLDGVEYVDDHVHEHPYQAALVAGGVGLLIGWLIGSKK